MIEWENTILWKYETNKRKEKLIRWIVWRLPREFILWCYVRVVLHATTGKYGDTIVPELSMLEALKRWDDDRNSKRR